MSFEFENQIKSKTDDELIDIYINQDFYQPEFINAAMQEMTGRKLPLDAIKKIKSEKQKVDISALAIGKQGSPVYIALCFCLALLGGLPAIISGYIYGFSKQKGSDGNLYFVYNETTRKLGFAMIAIGAVAIFIELQFR